MNKMRTISSYSASDLVVLANSHVWPSAIQTGIPDMVPHSIGMRPACPKDIDFLFDLYANTQPNVPEPSPCEEPVENSAAWAEFLLYNQHLRELYPQADFQIILLNGIRAGQLIVNRLTSEIFIVDLTLLPAYADTDICQYVLRDLLSEATLAQKPVRASINSVSPLVNSYQQLGFCLTGSINGRYLMRWLPKQATLSNTLHQESYGA